MVVRTMHYKVASFGLSDIGRVRQNNEDVWAEIPELQFYILADGMGGHQAGEIASHTAVNSFCELVRDLHQVQSGGLTLQELRRNLSWLIEEVNSAVYSKGRSDVELKGMGTTLCCLHFYQDGLVYAHVGDSRIYQMRGNHLRQMTKDHSLLRQMIDSGKVDERKASDFVYKNIITKAIGTEAHVHPSVYATHIEIDDVYMMCTDGLSDLLTIKEMENLIIASSSIQDAAQALVAKANELGGHDNITVVIMKVTPE